LAAVEKQRLAFAGFHAFDFADEDGVIAGGMFADDVAGEFGERTVQERNSAGGPLIRNAEASIFLRRLIALGKMLGESLLTRAENGDAKAALRFEERKQPGFVRDADQNEKRFQRDRGEGIGGHAVYHAGLALNSYHGYAGGECAGDSAKRYGIERRDGHGAIN